MSKFLIFYSNIIFVKKSFTIYKIKFKIFLKIDFDNHFYFELIQTKVLGL